jgi:hypothetical protein
VVDLLSCSRVCGTRIRVEMSSGRTRRDEGRRGGGSGGPRRDDRGGGRGGGRHRFETQSSSIVTNSRFLYFPKYLKRLLLKQPKPRSNIIRVTNTSMIIYHSPHTLISKKVPLTTSIFLCCTSFSVFLLVPVAPLEELLPLTQRKAPR